MEISSHEDLSLICQFNIKYDSNLSHYLINQSEKLFALFGYDIKKIVLATNKKVLSPSYKKFKILIDSDEVDFICISFQSDFNSKDFEPNTRLYIQINNIPINSKGVIKYSVIINDKSFMEDIVDTYKKLIDVISENGNVELSGFSFTLPNYYGPISFAAGILRRMNMPCSLKNLAAWYPNAGLKLNTLGIANCMSNLTNNHIKELEKIFGKDNVFRHNNIISFINSSLFDIDISEYITSTRYKKDCSDMEKNLPFERALYHKER